MGSSDAFCLGNLGSPAVVCLYSSLLLLLHVAYTGGFLVICWWLILGILNLFLCVADCIWSTVFVVVVLCVCMFSVFVYFLSILLFL